MPQKTIVICEKDLPIACPNKDTDPRFLHPRVFLPLNAKNPKVVCPYCNAKYEIENH